MVKPTGENYMSMILVVKTCDGPMYYSDQREASKMAAVRAAIEQLRYHPEVFDWLDEGEAEEKAKAIENANKPLNAAIDAGVISKHRIIDS
jgi:hypothetical protein